MVIKTGWPYDSFDCLLYSDIIVYRYIIYAMLCYIDSRKLLGYMIKSDIVLEGYGDTGKQ